jgi:hypothetical protein
MVVAAKQDQYDDRSVQQALLGPPAGTIVVSLSLARA